MQLQTIRNSIYCAAWKRRNADGIVVEGGSPGPIHGLAAGARSYHRLHGTSSRFPDHQRMFLYERNSLRLIMKNFGDGLLPRTLAPALLLTAKRAGVRTGLDGAPYRIGGDREPTEEVPRLALAHLLLAER